MSSAKWNKTFNVCCSCGKEIEFTKDLYEFTKKGIFRGQTMIYCKQCLINRLNWEGFEKRGLHY